MRRFAFLAIIVLAFTLASCGGDVSPTTTPAPDATVVAMWTRQANDATRYAAPPPTATSKPKPTATTPTTPTPNPNTLLTEAFSNMNKLDSYHVTSVVSDSGAEVAIDGDFSATAAQYSMINGTPPSEVMIMVVNGVGYLSPDGGVSWQKSDQVSSPSDSITGKGIFTSVASNLKDMPIAIVGTEGSAGNAVTHLRSSADVGTAGSYAIDVWIGNNAQLGSVVSRVHEVIKSPTSGTDIAAAYSNINVPLTLSTPVIVPATPTHNPIYVVTYKVTGQGTTSGDITANNDTGGNDQKTVPVGWHQDYKFKLGDFYYLSVQNGSGVDSSSISCEVLVDGKSVKTATSNGAYAIATCSGTVGGQP